MRSRQPARAAFARVLGERALGRVLDLARSSSARSAALTDASFGNALETAGSMTTMFDSAAMRRAYFPRAIGPKSLRLYSGRSQSLDSDLTFFIDIPLHSCRQACADDSNRISALGVRNSEQASMRRDAESDKPELRYRVLQIARRGCKIILQRRNRFFERNTMLSDVRRRLRRIPRKVHSSIIRQTGRCSTFHAPGSLIFVFEACVAPALS